MTIYGTFVGGRMDGEEVTMDSDAFCGAESSDVLEKTETIDIAGQRYRVERVHFDTWNLHFMGNLK